jgi:hypothetical protein
MYIHVLKDTRSAHRNSKVLPPVLLMQVSAQSATHQLHCSRASVLVLGLALRLAGLSTLVGLHLHWQCRSRFSRQDSSAKEW